MKVSVLLPNLNNRKYIEERLDTIIHQTYTDWELIIVDNFSDDGAWDVFKEYATKDTRIKISQAPRKGMYANWNNCIHLAKGEYIYIATSDDTMEADFLEKMVSALDKHPDCGIAHCCLKIIDEKGEKAKKSWDEFQNLRYFNNEVKRSHIRYAPLDGILYATIGMIYTSITQLLIRKQVFDAVGEFLTDHGSIADFEWEMRATLNFNTIHVPEYLATWRVHDEQATSEALLGTAFLHEKYAFFIEHAIQVSREKGLLQFPLNIKELQHDNLWTACRMNFKNASSNMQRLSLITAFFLKYPLHLTFSITQKIFGSKKKIFSFGQKIIAKFNLKNNVKYV